MFLLGSDPPGFPHVDFEIKFESVNEEHVDFEMVTWRMTWTYRVHMLVREKWHFSFFNMEKEIEKQDDLAEHGELSFFMPTYAMWTEEERQHFLDDLMRLISNNN